MVGLDMYTWGIKYFHKCWLGSLAKRRLCLGPAGVRNCTPLSALSFWVSLFPGERGYNKGSSNMGQRWCQVGSVPCISLGISWDLPFSAVTQSHSVKHSPEPTSISPQRIQGARSTERNLNLPLQSVINVFASELGLLVFSGNVLDTCERLTSTL